MRNQHLVCKRNHTTYQSILDWIYLPSVVINASYILEPRPRRYKCGLSAPCPAKHLAFRLVSGAANVIGPKICLEDKMWESVVIFSFFVYVCFSPAVIFLVLFWFTVCSFFPSLLSFWGLQIWGAECKYCLCMLVPPLFICVPVGTL